MTEETTTEQTTEVEQAEDTGKGGNEAAKYRVRLREAEAARDALAQRLAGYQRAEVERQAGELEKPSAIWATGVDLPDLLTQDGQVDADAVAAAIQRARDELGSAVKCEPAVFESPASHRTGPPAPSERQRFTEAFAPRRDQN